MKRINVLLVIALTCCGLILKAQTFHAIVFCNTIDESIGSDMQIEFNNLTKNIGIIQNLIEDEYAFETIFLDGEKCTRANLKAAIDRMEVGSDDVIFTFYGGHGTHAKNNESDPWPQYCMNTGFENQSNWVPMALLEKWVAAKNPRLRIILSNCCNKEQSATTVKPMWLDGGRATPMQGYNGENFKKLFAGTGCVMGTSSRLGEYSYCNSYGGLFTNDLWEVLDQVGKGSTAPDWETVLKETKAKTDARNIPVKGGGIAKQHPYYNVSLNGNYGPDKGKSGKGYSSSDENLNAALNRLVNKSIGQDERLAMIPGILTKYFHTRSKVLTIANDMQTGVDYEDAEDFLRRICLSSFISGITVLNDNTNLLKVHELR